MLGGCCRKLPSKFQGGKSKGRCSFDHEQRAHHFFARKPHELQQADDGESIHHYVIMSHRAPLLTDHKKVSEHIKGIEAWKCGCSLTQNKEIISKRGRMHHFHLPRLPWCRRSDKAIRSWVMEYNHQRGFYTPIIQWWALEGTCGDDRSGGYSKVSSVSRKIPVPGEDEVWLAMQLVITNDENSPSP